MTASEAVSNGVKVSAEDELDMLGQRLSRAARLVEHGQDILGDGMSIRRPQLGYILVTEEVDAILAGAVAILREIHHGMMAVAGQIIEDRQSAVQRLEG